MGRFRVLILECEDDITAEERSNASGLVP